MSSFLDNWFFSAHIALVLYQLGRRVEQFLTFVALVSSGFRVLTKGTVAYHESICKEHAAVLTETLGHGLLIDFAIFVHIVEYFLDNFGVPLSAGPSEMIKTTIEPLIYF